LAHDTKFCLEKILIFCNIKGYYYYKIFNFQIPIATLRGVAEGDSNQILIYPPKFFQPPKIPKKNLAGRKNLGG